jgi:hypothetical protein
MTSNGGSIRKSAFDSRASVLTLCKKVKLKKYENKSGHG